MAPAEDELVAGFTLMQNGDTDAGTFNVMGRLGQRISGQLRASRESTSVNGVIAVADRIDFQAISAAIMRDLVYL